MALVSLFAIFWTLLGVRRSSSQLCSGASSASVAPYGGNGLNLQFGIGRHGDNNSGSYVNCIAA